MKIYVTQHDRIYATAHPVDDEARQWLYAQCPVERHQYYGPALVVPYTDVEKFENKFLADGGQMI